MKRKLLSALLLIAFGIIAQAEPMGWVSNDMRPFFCGQTIQIAAQADEGYQFTQWEDGDITNPRTVEVGTEMTYTAQFTKKTPTAVDNVDAQTSTPRKMLIDDKLYILLDDKLYDATGKRVR